MTDSGRVAVVGAALLRNDPVTGRTAVLASRRTEPPRLAGLWEFAGGKVEPGENDEQALRRELREELRVEVEVGDRIGSDLLIRATGVLRVYLARLVSGEPALVDHDAHRWLTADQLGEVEWIPLNLPVVHALCPVLDASGDAVRRD